MMHPFRAAGAVKRRGARYIAAMSHIPPLDPNVAARKGFRESEERLKRFWKAADVAKGEGGWSVTLDGRTPRTPAHAPLTLPTEAAARLAADEWSAQGEFLDPATMPATRLASTAIDRVSQVREAVADEISAFAGSDLLCYLAEHPNGRRGATGRRSNWACIWSRSRGSSIGRRTRPPSPACANWPCGSTTSP